MSIKYGAPLPIVETKAKGDAWEVTGYAATYDNVDLGGDVILPGAFDGWLASGSKTRFLHSHRPDRVLGTVRSMTSDGRGLKVTAQISKTPLGEETYTLLKDGAIDSFSIGYITNDSEMKNGVRQLKDLDLPEVSLVAIPMNPQATVTAWKDWLSEFALDTPEPATLSEKAAQLTTALQELLTDYQALAGSHDLTQKKRDDLAVLLETFSGIGDVHQTLTALVNSQPLTGKATARRVLYELEQRRAKLAHIL